LVPDEATERDIMPRRATFVAMETVMGLKDQLASDLKDAMRAGDALRRDTLRSVITAINNAEIGRVDIKDESAGRETMGDADALGVIQKQAKQRRESIEEFKKGGRQDLVDRETAELAILDTYLPQQMTRDEVAAEVRAVIAETGAGGPGAKPKVMPAAIARMKGRADGRLINEVVTELLGT
jgi:uncharacterized protein YqeY